MANVGGFSWGEENLMVSKVKGLAGLEIGEPRGLMVQGIGEA